jgi:hypothetical protein
MTFTPDLSSSLKSSESERQTHGVVGQNVSVNSGPGCSLFRGLDFGCDHQDWRDKLGC